MQKHYLLLFATFAFVSGFAQEKEEKTLKESTWSARINAISLIDAFTFPTIQLSVEKKITSKYSVVLEGGCQFYSITSKSDTVFEKPRGGYKASIEFRAYVLQVFNSKHALKPGGLFAGVQPFYRKDQYNGSVTYHKIADIDAGIENPFKYDDSYGVRRKVYGVNLTAGYQVNIRKNFIFELAVGIGYMRRKIENSNMQFNPETDDPGYSEWFGDNDRYDTSGNSVNVFAAVRFGYKF